MNLLDYFDRHALEYDSWYDRHPEIFDQEVRVLKNSITINQPSVEIGIGTGRFAAALNIDFGVDSSFNMLKLARAKGLEVICGVGEDLPLESGFFSTVFLIVTIEFVSDPARVLWESKRILRQNGNLVVAFIESNSELGRVYRKKGGFYEHARFFTEKDLIGMIKKIGYTEIRTYHSQIPGFTTLLASKPS